MMLARSPAKRSPKTPERRKATPEGAPAVEADWTPPELATPATPAVEEAAQFEDERDALRARLDAAERALAADDAARGAAAETRRVAAALLRGEEASCGLDRVAALRRSRRGGDDGASVADSRLSSELRRSGAQLAELRRVDGRLRREADLRPFLRYEDTPGTSYEEWRSVRSEPRVETRYFYSPPSPPRLACDAAQRPRGAASRAAGAPATAAARGRRLRRRPRRRSAPRRALQPAPCSRATLAGAAAEGAAPTSRRGGRLAPRAAPRPGRRSRRVARASTSRRRQPRAAASTSRPRVRDAAPPPSPRTVAVNFAGVFLLLFALYCLFAACKAAVNVCARRAYEEDEHDRSTWYERARESADEEFGTVELSLRAAARARGAVELQTKRKVADAADEAPADAFSVANPMERTPRTPRTAMAEAADAFSVVNPMARRSTTSV
ncbi:endonuclease [Aureococcus anophagefferens]|nr:endonuclease [Aureococcus anophagefferens]